MLALARACLLVALLLGWGGARGQTPVPALTGRVVDQTGTLDGGEVESLSRRLQDFETRKGSQIAVLIVPTTSPETIEQFSIRVADQWKLGRKQVDDGAILVVAKNDRTLRIEVGYGLEGALTDAISNRIIDETIVPRFKQQDFAGGVDAGVSQMMAVIDGESLPAPAPRAWSDRGAREVPSFVPVVFGLAIVLAGVLPALFGRLGGSMATGALVGAVTWGLAGALSMAVLAGLGAMAFALLGGMGLLGNLGGGYRGGRGWGGGGGGGFSGGGGGFGGGGASGRW